MGNLYRTESAISESLSAGHYATLFHALSEPLRLEVLERLRGEELCVAELVSILGVAQSKLSFHLKVLKVAGLVRTRTEKRWIYYSINLPGLVAAEQYLAEFRRFSPMLPARPLESKPG